ncbi:MAG: GTPase [Candidatus Micrarchaeota archaeon]
MDKGMNKWIQLKKLIKEANVIVEVVDARDIDGTRLKQAETMAGTNRLLIVVNKVDLLPEDIELTLPKNSIAISAKEADSHERKMFMRAIIAKAIGTPVRALFVGYPNIGKSSLINLLAQRRAAKVSSIAGTTKNVQWVKISDELMVTDYRGLFPEWEGRMGLVTKGALNTEGHEDKYAHEYADKVLKSIALRGWLEDKFDIDLSLANTAEDVLEAIARRRNWYVKGGELNIPEAMKALVRSMREAPEL